MRIRRTAFGMALATALALGASSCGGDDKTPRTADTPSITSSTPPPTPTPTPVDPTAAAKTKIMADYQSYIAVRSRGIVSNDPTFPYEQVMAGRALAAVKSVVAGSQMIGTKYSGNIRFVKGHVATLNLKAKPATATVQACIFDGLKATSKSGKVTSSSIETSTNDRLVLVGGRWKATETQSLDKSAPGCS
jgi:hypothetical protein